MCDHAGKWRVILVNAGRPIAGLSDMLYLITLKLTSPLFLNFPTHQSLFTFIQEEFIIIMHNLRSGSMFFCYVNCTVNIWRLLLNYAWSLVLQMHLFFVWLSINCIIRLQEICFNHWFVPRSLIKSGNNVTGHAGWWFIVWCFSMSAWAHHFNLLKVKKVLM